ncbi:hypothetical protein [Nocardiopsis ganjiahuensis]|uniref:hypothetical protein n=1 Tax=Nocardiopsis ganjiahuensis TaxID=239984 RepID=UPI0012681169|nr:hypothetical protein [Nocardiopsis ganjiahuensis]
MSDSSRKAIQVLTGIEVPTANPQAMRAAAEVYDGLSVKLREDLTGLMNTVRGRVRRNFGGQTSEFYDRSLNQFTRGENDYLGSAATISQSLSVELRKGAANAEYMSAMVIVQFVQLLVEIAWAVASAKFTFGATLKYIPIFKMIRSLAMQRILAWFLITVPGHQIISQLFASMDSVIQRIQIANGTRDTWDHDLTKGAHVGAVVEGLVSAGLSGALGAAFDRQIATLITNRIDLLRGLPDPVPVPPVGKGVPDPVPPPGPLREIDDLVPSPSGTGRPDPVPSPDGPPSPVPGTGTGGNGLNRDLADVFARHRDEMAVPFGSNAPPGATAWNNAANRARFREDVAGVFERNFGHSLGRDQARRLGSDYAETLVRTWNSPDMGAQLSRTLGDSLPPPVRDHLARVPGDVLAPVHQHFGSKGTYLTRLGAGAASGATEGYLGEGLGNAAMGQGFSASVYSATSGASMNTVQQVSTDGALTGIDAVSGPSAPPPPVVPPPDEGETRPEPSPEASERPRDTPPQRSPEGVDTGRPEGSGTGWDGAALVVGSGREDGTGPAKGPDDPDSDSGSGAATGSDGSRAEDTRADDEDVRVSPSRGPDAPVAPPDTGGPARVPEFADGPSADDTATPSGGEDGARGAHRERDDGPALLPARDEDTAPGTGTADRTGGGALPPRSGGDHQEQDVRAPGTEGDRSPERTGSDVPVENPTENPTTESPAEGTATGSTITENPTEGTTTGDTAPAPPPEGSGSDDADAVRRDGPQESPVAAAPPPAYSFGTHLNPGGGHPDAPAPPGPDGRSAEPGRPEPGRDDSFGENADPAPVGDGSLFDGTEPGQAPPSHEDARPSPPTYPHSELPGAPGAEEAQAPAPSPPVAGDLAWAPPPYSLLPPPLPATAQVPAADAPVGRFDRDGRPVPPDADPSRPGSARTGEPDERDAAPPTGEGAPEPGGNTSPTRNEPPATQSRIDDLPIARTEPAEVPPPGNDTRPEGSGDRDGTDREDVPGERSAPEGGPATTDDAPEPVSPGRDGADGGAPRPGSGDERGAVADRASGDGAERAEDTGETDEAPPPAYDAQPSPPPYPFTELLDALRTKVPGPPSPDPAVVGDLKWLLNPGSVLPPPAPTDIQVFMADVPLGPLGPDGRALPTGEVTATGEDPGPRRGPGERSPEGGPSPESAPPGTGREDRPGAPEDGTAGTDSDAASDGADTADGGDPNTPHVWNGSLPVDRDGEAHDLDYLVGSRLVGPDRLRTDGVPNAIERSLREMGPRMPRHLRDQVLAEVERTAVERGMAPFFTGDGHEITVGTGDDTWRVRVRLAADRPSADEPPVYRHVNIRTGEGTDATVISGQERTRTVGSGDTVTRGARRGLSVKFTANPLYFGPTFADQPVGPSFTVGASGGTRLRGSTSGGSTRSTAVQAMDNSAAAEVYTADLRMDLGVTPPVGPVTRGPHPAVVRDGMALILSGKAQKRPEDTPDHISLTRRPAGAAVPDDGPTGADHRSPRRNPRTLHGGLPVKIERIVPQGGPADAPPTHTDLGSWLADRLVPKGADSATTPGSEGRAARDLHRTLRALFDNDSLQEYLPHLSRGPLTLKVANGDGSFRMMRLASSANEYRALGHAPHLGELTRHDGSEHAVNSSGSRSRTIGFSVGAGVNIELSLPGGGMTRIDVPTLEYVHSRTLDAETHSFSRTGSRRTLARDIAGTEDFLAYRVERDLFVHLEGEPTPHAFTGETVEIVSRHDAESLNDASGAGPRRRDSGEHHRPPLAHLRGDTVTDLSGATVLGFDRPERSADAETEGSGSEDRPRSEEPTVYERLQQEVLDSVAREHPGMVIPDLARSRADYALRPAREGVPPGERMWRETYGLRRNYLVARENTLRVLDALTPDALHARDAELTSDQGLMIHLTENAVVDPSLAAKGAEVLRPDNVTVHVHARFGGLTFDGRTPTETGVRLGGEARSGAARGKGSSHTLNLTAGAGLLRSKEADARGMGHRMGGVSAALSGSRARSSGTSRGVAHTSDETILFPGGSDVWRGPVGFTARLSDYEGSAQARGTDQSKDLFTGPIRAEYSVITPRVLTESAPSAPRDPDPGHEELSAEQARSLIEGPFASAPAGDASRGRDGESAEQARERRRAEDLVRAGGFVERIGIGPTSRTFELFSGFRRGLFQGFERKLRNYLNTTGGRTYFQELLSPVGMADDPSTTAPSGRRGRPEMSGGVRSPGDLRATTATRVEPDRIAEFQQVEMQVIAHGETGVEIGATDSVTWSAGARVGGTVGGTGNRIVDEAAQKDPATAVPPKDAVGPTPVAGANDTWNFFRSGRGTSAGASFVSSTTIVPKAALGYAFRLAGRATQAVELAHRRGLTRPGSWERRFRGWTARVHDLVSGYIPARDAQEAGIVQDRVVEHEDGRVELSAQDNPADITDVRIRPGFEDSGKRVRPADPTAALESLVEQLRARGHELTAGSRERLFEALTTRLGNASGTSEPVAVRVRRTSSSGEPRSGHRSQDALVHVELRTTARKVEYLASSDAVIESHTWTAATGSSRSSGTGNTVGGEGVLLQPTPFDGDDNPPGSEPDSRPLFVSPAVSGGASASDTTTRGGGEERTHTVQLEMNGPYAKVEQDSDLVLTLRGPRGLEIGAQESSGPIHTLYPYSYLDFSPRTDGAGTGPGPHGELGPPVSGSGPEPGNGRAGAASTTAATDPGNRRPATTVDDAPAAGRSPSQALADRARTLFTGGQATRLPEGVVMMPAAVGDGGRGVRDTAAVVLARSLGWRPGTADLTGTGGYTDEGFRQARDFTAQRLHLDRRHSPIDSGLESVALKALFSRTLGHEDGVALMDLGSTGWRLTALPDLSGARILDVVAGSRLSTTTEEKRSLTESSDQARGTAVDPSLRPAGLTADKDVYENHAGVLNSAVNAPLGTNTATAADGRGSATSGPPTRQTQRLGPAYLVEFDTAWVVSASSEGGGVHAGHTRSTVGAWVSRSDALRLGLVTPERAARLDAEAERVHDAAETMGDDEQAYGRERGRLEEPVRDYLRAHEVHRRALEDRTGRPEREARDGSSQTSDWAADRLQESRDAYREQEDRYRRSLRQYEDSTRTWVDTLNTARGDFRATTADDAPAPAGSDAPAPSGTSLRDAVATELDPRTGDPADPGSDLRRRTEGLSETVADLRRREGLARSDVDRAASLIRDADGLLTARPGLADAPPGSPAPTPAGVADLRSRTTAFQRDLARLASSDDQNDEDVTALDARRDALLEEARTLHAGAETHGALAEELARATRVGLDRVVERMGRARALVEAAGDRVSRMRTETLNTQARHRPLAEDVRDPEHAAVRGEVERLGSELTALHDGGRDLAARNHTARPGIDQVLADADAVARRELPRFEERARVQHELSSELLRLGGPLVADVISDLRGEGERGRGAFDEASDSLDTATRLLEARAAASRVPPPAPGPASPEQAAELGGRVAALERDLAAFASLPHRSAAEVARMEERRDALLEETEALGAPVSEHGRRVSGERSATETALAEVVRSTGRVRELVDGSLAHLRGLHAEAARITAEYAPFLDPRADLRTSLEGARNTLTGLDGLRSALETRLDGLTSRTGALTNDLARLREREDGLRALHRELSGLRTRLDGAEVPEAAPRPDGDAGDSGSDSDSERAQPTLDESFADALNPPPQGAPRPPNTGTGA